MGRHKSGETTIKPGHGTHGVEGREEGRQVGTDYQKGTRKEGAGTRCKTGMIRTPDNGRPQ